MASGDAVAPFVATLFFTASGFCGCEPAHVTGITILVMVVSTIVTLADTATFDVPRRLARAATLTGYTALAILLATGLDRTFDEIRRITWPALEFAAMARFAECASFRVLTRRPLGREGWPTGTLTLSGALTPLAGAQQYPEREVDFESHRVAGGRGFGGRDTRRL